MARSFSYLPKEERMKKEVYIPACSRNSCMILYCVIYHRTFISDVCRLWIEILEKELEVLQCIPILHFRTVHRCLQAYYRSRHACMVFLAGIAPLHRVMYHRNIIKKKIVGFIGKIKCTSLLEYFVLTPCEDLIQVHKIGSLC